MKLSSLKAEDSAFGYLVHNFSHDVALAIANRVEFLLATRWEHQQEELRKNGYERAVMQIPIDEMARSRYRFHNTPPGNSNSDGEQTVIDLLSGFPADRAWLIARKVREQIAGIGRAYCRATPSLKEPATL